MAAEVADRRYAEGVLDAATTIASILRRAGMRLDRGWWEAMDVGDWDKGGAEGWGEDDLQAAALERVRRTSSARLSPPGERVPNMWDAWAARPAPERIRSADTAILRREDQRVGIRRMLGLPVVGRGTDIAQPRSCAHCGAPAISYEGGDGMGAESTAGPRATLDVNGEHALTCIMAKGETQRRHNTLASAIRECAEAAGWRAACGVGQVFMSHRGRPADIWIENHPRHRGGLAVDCTIVSAAGQDGAHTAERRERRKIDKYKAEVARHPELGFEPFAVDLYGNLGPAAWRQMQQWAVNQAARRDATVDYNAALGWVTSTIGCAFATGAIRQVRRYYDGQRESAKGSAAAGIERKATTTRRRRTASGARAASDRENTDRAFDFSDISTEKDCASA
jgi:hypothetical protein